MIGAVALPRVQFDAVCDDNEIQTVNAKWLKINNIYSKYLHRREYDIGGTYIADALEYWFLCKTDQLGDNYLFHLFVVNRQESSYCVKTSRDNGFTHLPHNAGCVLSQDLKNYHFEKCPDNTYNLVTTFSFDSYDLDQLKGRDLFIPIRVSNISHDAVANNPVQTIKLKHDLSGLLKDPIFTDFTIETIEGYQFKVHRAILISQSEVFRAMLKKDTAESQNNIARLQFTKEEIALMLEYIYTGTVNDMSTCEIINLLLLADHYNLPGLSRLIQDVMCSQLTVSNVINVYNHAEMHNCDYLKNAALKYIKKNSELVLQSDDWKTLNDSALIKQIIGIIKT